MNTEYNCPYCEQKGGKPLGEDTDGNQVCTKCGYVDEFNDPVHNPEWSWNITVAYNKSEEDDTKLDDIDNTH